MSIIKVLEILKDDGYNDVGIMDQHDHIYCNIRSFHRVSSRVIGVLRRNVPADIKLTVIVRLPIIPITIQKEAV